MKVKMKNIRRDEETGRILFSTNTTKHPEYFKVEISERIIADFEKFLGCFEKSLPLLSICENCSGCDIHEKEPDFIDEETGAKHYPVKKDFEQFFIFISGEGFEKRVSFICDVIPISLGGITKWVVGSSPLDEYGKRFEGCSYFKPKQQ